MPRERPPLPLDVDEQTALCRILEGTATETGGWRVSGDQGAAKLLGMNPSRSAHGSRRGIKRS